MIERADLYDLADDLECDAIVDAKRYLGDGDEDYPRLIADAVNAFAAAAAIRAILERTDT